jgi:hypothetical protein
MLREIEPEAAPLVLMILVPIVGVPLGIVSLLAWLFLRREDRRAREGAGGRDGESGG